MGYTLKELGEIFENNSNCYADTKNDNVVMAMDKEMFVKLVNRLLIASALGEPSKDASALPIHVVSNSLPTDKEIENEGYETNAQTDESGQIVYKYAFDDEQAEAFIQGAIWMRGKVGNER